MKRLVLRHVRGLFGVALIGALAGCAAQGNVARAQTAVVVPGGPGQLAAMARYVQGIRRQLRSDRVVNGILGRAHVVTPFAMLAVVTPKGFVQKAGVQAGVLPVAVSTALIDHVVNVNFGRFLPGMPDRPLTFEFPVHPVAGAPMAPEGSVFRQQTIVVYQPNQGLVARVGSAVPLANYVKQLDASLGAMFDAMAPEPGVTAALVMGVKPGGHSRAWVVKGRNDLSPALIARIERVAEAVPAVSVRGGPVAVGIIFNVWGGGVPITDAKHPVPMPKAWYQGAPEGNFTVPDGVFARIWK